jgi:23S rRNA pseudouridine1911/1915/1917 synthase
MDKLIIYEDKSVIVVHKPVGIATQTSKIGQADLASMLRNYRKQKGEDTYIGVVHRLDQPVEGLLVFAKTKTAAANLTSQLNKGILKKSYTALVDGNIAKGGKKELTDYLVKDGRTNLSRVADKGTKDAKEARLEYTCLENRKIDDCYFSAVNIRLFTGRHHQIRVQMSNAGFPLLGDMKYGNEHSKETSRRLGIDDTALFAGELSFKHPETSQKMDFSINFEEKWNIIQNSENMNNLETD